MNCENCFKSIPIKIEIAFVKYVVYTSLISKKYWEHVLNLEWFYYKRKNKFKKKRKRYNIPVPGITVRGNNRAAKPPLLRIWFLSESLDFK